MEQVKINSTIDYEFYDGTTAKMSLWFTHYTSSSRKTPKCTVGITKQ